jgi:hypothetical protein
MTRSPKVRIDSMPRVMTRFLDTGREPVNERAHEEIHSPKIIVYTSESTLTTDTGPPLRMPRGGEITSVRVKLTGAPSGADFKVDLLTTGLTVFGGGFCTVLDGETVSKFRMVDKRGFTEDTVFTVKVNTIASATGPFTMTIEYVEAY